MKAVAGAKKAVIGKKKVNGSSFSRNRGAASVREIKTKTWVLSNELIKVELPPRKIWKADVSSVSPSSERVRTIKRRLDHFITPMRSRY